MMKSYYRLLILFYLLPYMLIQFSFSSTTVSTSSVSSAKYAKSYHSMKSTRNTNTACSCKLNSKNDNDGLMLTCSGLFISNYFNDNDNNNNNNHDHEAWNLCMDSILQPNQLLQIKSIIIQNSTFLPSLDLSIFNHFTSLTDLAITNSEVNKSVIGVIGTLMHSSPGLTSLNLSSNEISTIHLQDIFINNGNGSVSTSSLLRTLDLSHNNLSQLNLDIFKYPDHRLKSLGLTGNNFTCAWVWSQLYKFWSPNAENDSSSIVLLNQNSTFCIVNEFAFDSVPFQIALQLKHVGIQECESTICSCDSRGLFINKLPNPSFPNIVPALNATIALKLDCSNMSLTQLPAITKFATELNVQHNSITSLSLALDRITTDPNYENLIGIDLSYNQLTSIEFLTEQRFMNHFQFIYLIGNQISQIPEHIIAQIFAEERRGLVRIKLGHNEIDCDCFTDTKLRPLLITNKKVIDDWSNISCKAPISKTLLDLKRADVCSNDGEVYKSDLDFLWYVLIGFEGALIIIIIGKVWYDYRQYRVTGNLPYFSHCIPRLPCDFMLLEGLKDN